MVFALYFFSKFWLSLKKLGIQRKAALHMCIKHSSYTELMNTTVLTIKDTVSVLFKILYNVWLYCRTLLTSQMLNAPQCNFL